MRPRLDDIAGDASARIQPAILSLEGSYLPPTTYHRNHIYALRTNVMCGSDQVAVTT